jgi:hypothetical protein
MQLPLPTPKICSHRMQLESQKLLHNQYCNLKTARPILLSLSYSLKSSRLPTARLARRSALSTVLRPVLRSGPTGDRALLTCPPESVGSGGTSAFYPTKGTSSIPLQHSIRSVEHLACNTAKAVESAALMENPAGFTTGLGQVFDLPTLTTALLRNFFY